MRYILLSLVLPLLAGCNNSTEPATTPAAPHKTEESESAATAGERSCTPPKGATLTAKKPGGTLDFSRTDKAGVAHVVVCDGDGIARPERITGLIGSRALEEPNIEFMIATTSLVPVEVPDLGITVQCLKLWHGACDPAPVPPPVVPAAPPVVTEPPAAAPKTHGESVPAPAAPAPVVPAPVPAPPKPV